MTQKSSSDKAEKALSSMHT